MQTSLCFYIHGQAGTTRIHTPWSNQSISLPASQQSFLLCHVAAGWKDALQCIDCSAWLCGQCQKQEQLQNDIQITALIHRGLLSQDSNLVEVRRTDYILPFVPLP